MRSKEGEGQGGDKVRGTYTLFRELDNEMSLCCSNKIEFFLRCVCLCQLLITEVKITKKTS